MIFAIYSHAIAANVLFGYVYAMPHEIDKDICKYICTGVASGMCSECKWCSKYNPKIVNITQNPTSGRDGYKNYISVGKKRMNNESPYKRIQIDHVVKDGTYDEYGDWRDKNICACRAYFEEIWKNHMLYERLDVSDDVLWLVLYPYLFDRFGYCLDSMLISMDYVGRTNTMLLAELSGLGENAESYTYMLEKEN